MANKTLNRPNNWQKQVNPNTKRMRQLMRDVRANVERRTRNSQDLDAWMENLSEYVGNNCFSTGIHATDALDIVNQIAGVVDQTSLPSGSNAEILKGTMAEKCYTMVTNVGEDIKNELRQIAVNGYNDRLTPQQLAKEMGNKIESLDKARCQAIARTETCRAANIGNYINAREMGAKSYSVICNDGCCEYCQEAYGTDDAGGVGEEIFDIEDTDSLPPFHPNCRGTPVWSMDPPPGTEDETTVEDELLEPTEEQLQENLTPEEYIRYTRTIDRDIENYYKSYTETFKDDKKLVDLFKTKYEGALKEKEALIEKARTGGDKQEPFSISPLENYSMETLRNDVPIEEKTFDKLVDWSKTRASKNKIEYGYQFDTSTGELIGNEVRGKKGSVTFTQQGTNIGSMHTHPPVEGDVGGGSFPSKQDLKVYRSQRGADHLIGSPTEIWYVHAEENLNSGVLGQREIDAIYTKVYNEVTEKGQELVKQGKLKTDNDSLRKFMDKEIGDGLLREFNTKEWRDKGFYIRRVYR